jgi:hypothetical protein
VDEDSLRKELSFKYHKVPGGQSWLVDEGHAIGVPISDDLVKIIDDKIFADVFVANTIAKSQEDMPAEVITGNPRKAPKESSGDSMIVTAKSPQQIEKDAKEEVDHISGLAA